MNSLNRLWTENRVTRSPRNPQPFRDVLLGLLVGKRGGTAAEHDALAELAKLRKFELLLQFGLTGENNLQQLVRGSLQIREQADFLQDRISQILRFINNQDDGFSEAIALEEPVIELQELLALRLGFARDVELRENEIE